MRKEIECLICRERIEFPEYISAEDYVGALRCATCQSLFDVVLKSNKVREYHYRGNSIFSYGELVSLLSIKELNGIRIM